jgi:hypothetical protein
MALWGALTAKLSVKQVKNFTFSARKSTASMVPSAYIDLPHTLCWNSKETLQEKKSENIFVFNKERKINTESKWKWPIRMFVLTFYQVMTDNRNEMHDQTNTHLELPPTLFVPWDPESFLSGQTQQKII